MDKEEYYKCFSETEEKVKEQKSKHEEALIRAWKNRDFEIEMYWKRAAYFWVFIATTFAGYFALQTVDKSKIIGNEIDIRFLSFIVICLGICFSWSWVLVNKGSKKWQENWEAHIDMLEDRITGSIYKIVLDKERHNYSVSKINLGVSQFVCGIWFILLAHFLYTNRCHLCLFTSLILIVFLIFFLCIYRKRKTDTTEEKKFHFHLRKSEIFDENG